MTRKYTPCQLSKMAARAPATKEEQQPVMRTVQIGLPAGPTHPDLAPCSPSRVTRACLPIVFGQSPRAWVNSNVLHFDPHYLRWRNRRGAVFLHRRIFGREMQRRVADGSIHWFPNEPLAIPRYEDLARPGRDGDARIVAPADLPRLRPLDSLGRMTREGLAGLDDAEFVWPWPDSKLPDGRTEYEAASEFERVWATTWAGNFAENDEPGPGGGVWFHHQYANEIKAMGRGGYGTPLGRWLAAFEERGYAEVRRLNRV